MSEDFQSGTGFQPVDHGQDADATSLSSRVIAEHPPAEIVEKRDDHTRVWEIVREVETTHPDGSVTVETIRSYIHEKGSGLCYKDASGAYVPSVAEWRETPDGFVIDRCPYGLAMGKTIGVSARYTVEGNDLLLRPAYLIVSDGVNQADPRPLTPETPGYILPDNPSVLRFPSAFGEGYDLEYVAEKGGFHQNLIVANPPQLPDGFNSATASIHLYTELNLDQYLLASGCEVSVEGEEVNATAADLVTEPSRGGCISFSKDGRLLHAFSVSQVTDSSGPGALDKQTTAEKRLMKDPASRKAYLVESVPFSYFTEKSASYPITWDYQNITEPISGGTWEPRYTYRVSGNISIEGTLTILPGTTVKLDPSKKITIATNGKVIAKGEPYNYITFTRTRDNNCGEIITGPADAAYDRALEIQSGSSPDSVVQYCKFGRGGLGVDLHKTLTGAIAHNIFNSMNIAMSIVSCSATAHNNLMTYCSYYGIFAWALPSGSYTNNTIDHTATGIYDYGSSSFTAKDNLFSHCTTGIYTNYYAPDIRNNGFYQVSGGQWGSSPIQLTADPYASSGIGNYFLNNNNPGGTQLKNAGSRTALAAGLSDEAFTVLAPGAIPPSPYTEPQIWSKIASEEVGSLVDIGYHHCRTDVYLPFDLTINDGETTEGSLTIKPGVVVGILGDGYIMATNGGTLLSVGNPDEGGLIRLTNSKSLSMNIESPQFGMTGTNPFVAISSWASAQSSIQFTRTTWLGWGILINSARYLTTPIQHNIFSLSCQGVHAGLNSGNSLLNNLIHENVRGAYARGNTLVGNCTFDRNETGLEAGADWDEELTIKDCLFTHNSVQGILINSGAGDVVNDYNGFYGNTQDINGGTWGPNSWSDKQGAPHPLTQSPYYSGIETGWQLHYRLNQSSPLIDVGSRTSMEAGLDTFTTAADGRPDLGPIWQGHDGNRVDIGYHFPIGGPEGILYQGYRQTDIALRYNQRDKDCPRAFSFDGHTRDEIGNADGYGSDLRYGYYRYSYGYPGGIKFDYNKAAEFYYNSLPSDVDTGNATDIQSMQTGTISAWVCPHTMGDNGNPTIFYKRANSGETEAKWLRLSTVDGQRRLQGTVAPAATVTSDTTVSLSAWHHVAMTWDYLGGDTKVKLYLDGEARGSSEASGSPAQDSANHAYIGARKYQQQPGQFYEDNHFDGYIADVFIYNRPLDLDEIRWLACKTHDGWLTTPNFGAMGEFPPSPPNPPGPGFPLGQFQSADWAVQDNQGNIWVNEHGAQRVTKLSLDGVVIGKIGGSKGTGNDQLWDPYGIAIDSENNVYVLNNGTSDPPYPDATRVSVFGPQGAFLRRWGQRGSGDGQFIFPFFMAVDSVHAYVGDAGNHRVQKFNKDTGAYVCQWGQAPSDPYNRGPYEFYEVRGIAIDSEGYVWVCDRGPTGNVSYLKKFDSNGNFQSKIRVDRLSPYGTYNDYCSGIGILNEGGTDYIYSSGGEMVYCDHIAKWWVGTEEDGDPVSTFNFFGAGNDQSYAPWGGFPAPDTPPGTDHKVLSTCWFACKLQLWKPDGTWLNTFRSGMRSDAYSIKCKNTSAAVKYLYQRVNLEQSTYTVQFLAFTNGSDLSQNQDVVPYAERAVGNEPTGNNAITSPSYAEGVLTYVDIPPGNRLYYFVSGAFQVQEGQSGDWFLGLRVKPNKTAYVASLSCLKQ